MIWKKLKARRHILYLTGFLFLGGLILLASANPERFIPLVVEDCLLENWGEIFLFLAFDLFLLIALRNTGKKTAWGYWLMAALCFFLAMEEIDWLQRIFMRLGPVYLPDFITQQGADRFTVRAFLPSQVLGGRPLKFLLHLAFLVWGVFLPVLAGLFPRLGKKIREAGFPFPALSLSFGILLGQAISFLIEKTYTPGLSRNAFFVWEAADFFNYLVLLLTALEAWLTVSPRGKNQNWKWLVFPIGGIALLQALIMFCIISFGGEFPPLKTGKPPARTDLEIYTVLGNYYLEKGDLKPAERYLTPAAQAGWIDPAAYLGLGKIYLKEKAWNKAEACFKTALEKAGDIEDLNRQIGSELARLYRETGQKDKLTGLEKLLKTKTRLND